MQWKKKTDAPSMPLMRVKVPYMAGFCSYEARVPVRKLANTCDWSEVRSRDTMKLSDWLTSGMMMRLERCMILAEVCWRWSIPGSFLRSI